MGATSHVVVLPDELESLAAGLDQASATIGRSACRLDRQLATALKPSPNPEFSASDFRHRHRAAIAGLARVERSTERLSELAKRTADDARRADGGTGGASLGQLLAWSTAYTIAHSTSRTAQGLSTLIGLRLRRPRAESLRPGDPAGTYTTREVGEWRAGDGRSSVAEALALTGDGNRLGPDEFGLIVHHSTQEATLGAPTYTVVLPGVIDLSKPVAGLDPQHRSVRDLDAVAVPSAAAGGDLNLYAHMVSTALTRMEIPDGAHVNLVGHSFGAAAAMTLAEDPVFNGQRYDVRTVVAAGYYLDNPRPARRSTVAVVIENDNDIVVAAEALALRPFAGDRDEVVRFGGGRARLGHDPGHYQRFVESSGNEAIDRLAARLDADGNIASGAVLAVDVSVPEPPAPSAWRE